MAFRHPFLISLLKLLVFENEFYADFDATVADDLIAQTSGVECRKDTELLDEIPAAYKSIDKVIENQSDLVEVVATLKQVVCIKG